MRVWEVSVDRLVDGRRRNVVYKIDFEVVRHVHACVRACVRVREADVSAVATVEL